MSGYISTIYLKNDDKTVLNISDTEQQYSRILEKPRNPLADALRTAGLPRVSTHCSTKLMAPAHLVCSRVQPWRARCCAGNVRRYMLVQLVRGVAEKKAAEPERVDSRQMELGEKASPNPFTHILQYHVEFLEKKKRKKKKVIPIDARQSTKNCCVV